MANGGFIGKAEAQALVEKFKNNESEILNTPHAFLYDKTMIDQLFADNEGATGVRVYIGTDTNNQMKTILVAVDADGNDMYNGTTPCLDMGQPCPPNCGLNGL